MPTPHPLIKVDPSKFYVVYESGGRWNFLVKLGYPDKFQAITFLRRAILMESDDEAGDPEEMDFLQGCLVKSGQELISKGLKVIRPSKIVTEARSRLVLKRIMARLEHEEW